MSDILIVTIEGNIGGGKSTLLKKLKEYYDSEFNDEDYHIEFLDEPVKIWESIQDENGSNILEKFYGDQETFSFSFQIVACVSRFKVIKDALKKIKLQNINKKVIFITERSLYTDKMVFARMLYESDKISYINYQIYLNLFDTFSEDFPIHKVIYVKTSPERCHSRILKRSRDGEANIPLEYLTTCGDYHEKMLSYFEEENICNDQLILDGNIDIYENTDQVNKWISEIDEYIKNK
jgi:deoxyadenosine/deoxycytidine kinase